MRGSIKVKQTRAPRGTDRSPEYNEHFCYKLDSRVKNLTTQRNQKQQHFITHCYHCYEFRCSLPVWRSFLKKGTTPVTYFALPWIRRWANMAKTSLCMCRVMSTSSLPSFVNIQWLGRQGAMRHSPIKDLGRFIIQICPTYNDERCSCHMLIKINIYFQYIILTIWKHDTFCSMTTTFIEKNW